jgi:hypothetical protein
VHVKATYSSLFGAVCVSFYFDWLIISEILSIFAAERLRNCSRSAIDQASWLSLNRSFAPVIIKQDAYGLDNLNEHGAELSARDVTLDEQQTVAR